MINQDKIDMILAEIAKLNQEEPGSEKIQELTERISELNKTKLISSNKPIENKTILKG